MDARAFLSVFVLLMVAVLCAEGHRPYPEGHRPYPEGHRPYPWKPKPKRCCLPERFEAKLGLLEGVASRKQIPGLPFVAEGLLNLSVDFKKKRGAYSGNIYVNPPGIHTYQRAVIDYEKKLIYIISDDGKRCIKASYPSDFSSNCLPDSAKFIGSFYYGYGRSRLPAKAYKLQVSTPGTYFNITLSVTARECYPIGESIVGSTAGVGVLLTLGFANITPGIKDPKVFDLPSSCKDIAMASHESMATQHMNYFL